MVIADIQIGGNATYKPGIKMIKINSDPTVYVVSEGGEIRGIPSGGGSRRSLRLKLEPTDRRCPRWILLQLSPGDPTSKMASQFDADAEEADAFSIDADKGLQTYLTVSIADNEFSSSELTLDAGRAVRFVNDGDTKHRLC